MRISTLALCVALAACNQEAPKGDAADAASATIKLASFPEAQVLVDGEDAGITPLSKSVEPGQHEIVLRSEAFREVKQTISVAAGETASREWILQAEDPTDPVAVARLGAAFELAMADIEEVVRHRGAADESFVAPLFPRGNLRITDLVDYRIDVGAEFDAAGTLQFKKGRKVLYSAAFDPEELSTNAAIPAAVKDALAKGGTVTWGFHPTKGKAVTARFKIVRDARLDKRVAKMEKRMKGQDERLLQQMRAQLYLNKKLYYPAYLEARRVVEASENAPAAVAIMQSALQRLKLKKTVLWAEVQEKATGLSRKARERMNEARSKLRPRRR